MEALMEQPTTGLTVAAHVAFFVALLATALAMAAALAHALELSSKMMLGRDEYFVVQSIYMGWNRLGFLLVVEIIGILAVCFTFRDQPDVRNPAIVALVALLAAQAIFWIWTFPANQATANWTLKSPHWEDLRRQWEFSHFAGAVFQLFAMMSLILAVLKR
jgi:hypothetical protein